MQFFLNQFNDSISENLLPPVNTQDSTKMHHMSRRQNSQIHNKQTHKNSNHFKILLRLPSLNILGSHFVTAFLSCLSISPRLFKLKYCKNIVKKYCKVCKNWTNWRNQIASQIMHWHRHNWVEICERLRKSLEMLGNFKKH